MKTEGLEIERAYLNADPYKVEIIRRHSDAAPGLAYDVDKKASRYSRELRIRHIPSGKLVFGIYVKNVLAAIKLCEKSFIDLGFDWSKESFKDEELDGIRPAVAELYKRLQAL